MLFGDACEPEVDKPAKMVKSPTFGVLGTDRLMAKSPQKVDINPSIAFGMQHGWHSDLDSSEELRKSSEIQQQSSHGLQHPLKIESQSFFKGDQHLKNNPISPINRNQAPHNQGSLVSQEYDS